LFASDPGGFAGLLGVPVPGLELKLVPVGDKLEARYRGKNIFPGYWRQPEITEKVFDEEGFYCTGDALTFVNENDANKGMLFDGRLTEDFKLNTGTWVCVGNLRTQIIAAGKGLIQDVVITGHDNDFIAAIVFPGIDHCKKIMGINNILSPGELILQPLVRAQFQEVLNEIAKKSTGSSSLVKRAVFADFALSIDKGEITDKGSINQKMIIQNHPELIEKLYTVEKSDDVFEVERKDIGY
jgi:feruloyl-CoA synthase